MVSRRGHATQTGGCGFWIGFGTTLRGGIEVLALVPGIGLLGHHAGDLGQGLLHIYFSQPSISNPSSSERLVDSPVPNCATIREDVERRNLLGGAGRVAESG